MGIVRSSVKGVNNPLVAFFIEDVVFLLSNDIVIGIRLFDEFYDSFLTGNVCIGYNIDLALVVNANPFLEGFTLYPPGLQGTLNSQLKDSFHLLILQIGPANFKQIGAK